MKYRLDGVVTRHQKRKFPWRGNKIPAPGVIIHLVTVECVRISVSHLISQSFLPECVMSDKTREALEQPFASASDSAPAGNRALPKNGERRAHQKAITQGLRKFFDSVASEPVPDEFLELLKKMDDGKGGGA
jgi:hypothetical protein